MANVSEAVAGFTIKGCTAHCCGNCILDRLDSAMAAGAADASVDGCWAVNIATFDDLV